MMCGSDSRAASSDSRRNRLWNSALAPSWGGNRLSATVRLWTVSYARKTSPMPPRPRTESSRYGPNSCATASVGAVGDRQAHRPVHLVGVEPLDPPGPPGRRLPVIAEVDPLADDLAV